MRILYITTIGATMTFFESLIPELIKEGHIVDIACNSTQDVGDVYKELGCKVFTIDCTRSPLNLGNLKAIKQIKDIVKENGYDIVHCHTPIASACARIACIGLRKKGVKVFYTSHGFHFYNGAPKKNWLIYYPMEKICSFFTDKIITINKEDFELAKNHLNAKTVDLVHGVGINLDRFKDISADKSEVKKGLGIPEDAFVIISVGELNKNKNQQIIIKAISKLKMDNVHFIIAGTGEQHDNLEHLSKELGIEKQIHLLGFRTDIPVLMEIADICAFTSIREGLGMAAIEGMASGLPLIASDNRGTREYAHDGENAIVCKNNDPDEYASAILKLINDENLRSKMGKRNQEMVLSFDVNSINEVMKGFYFNS